jgi:hypothetical protein
VSKQIAYHLSGAQRSLGMLALVGVDTCRAQADPTGTQCYRKCRRRRPLDEKPSSEVQIRNWPLRAKERAAFGTRALQQAAPWGSESVRGLLRRAWPWSGRPASTGARADTGPTEVTGPLERVILHLVRCPRRRSGEVAADASRSPGIQRRGRRAA